MRNILFLLLLFAFSFVASSQETKIYPVQIHDAGAMTGDVITYINNEWQPSVIRGIDSIKIVGDSTAFYVTDTVMYIHRDSLGGGGKSLPPYSIAYADVNGDITGTGETPLDSIRLTIGTDGSFYNRVDKSPTWKQEFRTGFGQGIMIGNYENGIYSPSRATFRRAGMNATGDTLTAIESGDWIYTIDSRVRTTPTLDRTSKNMLVTADSINTSTNYPYLSTHLGSGDGNYNFTLRLRSDSDLQLTNYGDTTRIDTAIAKVKSIPYFNYNGANEYGHTPTNSKGQLLQASPDDLWVTSPTDSKKKSLKDVLQDVISSGGDGNGIYDGDGGAPANTTVTMTDSISFERFNSGLRVTRDHISIGQRDFSHAMLGNKPFGAPRLRLADGSGFLGELDVKPSQPQLLENDVLELSSSAKLYLNSEEGDYRMSTLPTENNNDLESLVIDPANGRIHRTDLDIEEPEFVLIEENGNTGWGLKHRRDNPSYYGDIGSNAIDLTYNSSASTTKGATGLLSVAVGAFSEASGDLSTAIGYIGAATGAGSIAISGEAQTNGSIAIGGSSIAAGEGSLAILRSRSNGDYSISMGIHGFTSGERAVGIMGDANGDESFAAARGRTASYNHVSFGNRGVYYHLDSVNQEAFDMNDPAFSLGISDLGRDRKSQVEIYKNGSWDWDSWGIDSVYNPTKGLHIVDTAQRLNYYTGTEWKRYLLEGEAGSNLPSLNEDEIVFGGASGEMEQETGFEWDGERLTLRTDKINYIGVDAGRNRAGSNNNYVGYKAGQYLLGSSHVTNNSNGFGYYSLLNNIGTISNGFGGYALQGNTGGNSNGFGYHSLLNNTGDRSNGFGNYALKNSTGNYSNGFGYYALSNNKGSNSNGFGHTTLLGNKGANSNGFGYYTLISNTGANSNGFGSFTLQNNTGNNANAFGYNSGVGNAYDNVYIFANNGSATKDNQWVLGDASQDVWIQGELGIKTDAPTKALDINGEARIRTINDNLNFNYVLVPDADNVIHKVHRDSVDRPSSGGSAEWVESFGYLRPIQNNLPLVMGTGTDQAKMSLYGTGKIFHSETTGSELSEHSTSNSKVLRMRLKNDVDDEVVVSNYFGSALIESKRDFRFSQIDSSGYQFEVNSRTQENALIVGENKLMSSLYEDYDSTKTPPTNYLYIENDTIKKGAVMSGGVAIHGGGYITPDTLKLGLDKSIYNLRSKDGGIEYIIELPTHKAFKGKEYKIIVHTQEIPSTPIPPYNIKMTVKTDNTSVKINDFANVFTSTISSTSGGEIRMYSVIYTGEQWYIQQTN